MSSSEEQSTSCVPTTMISAMTLSPLEYAKTIFQSSGKLKDEVILQTNELIDILRLRQQQLCQTIDEKSLEQCDAAEKHLHDNLFSFSQLNFKFQSNFEYFEFFLNNYGKIVTTNKTDESEVSPVIQKKSKIFIASFNNLLKDMKYRKISPFRSQDNESQVSTDSFEVFDDIVKDELLKLDKEYLMDNEEEYLEIISAEASEFTSGSESDFSPERCQKKSKLWWRNFKALERKFKQADLMKSLVREEKPLASNVVNNVASAQLVNNQSHLETSPKGLFSQALQEANKNTSWLAESSDKSSEAKGVLNVEETKSSPWLVSSEANNEAIKKKSSQISDIEEGNKLYWLKKPSETYNEIKQVSQTCGIEETKNMSSSLPASLKETLNAYIEASKKEPWLVEPLKKNNKVCRSLSSDVKKNSDFQPSVNKSRKPFEIVQFCFGSYLNDSPEEWLSSKINQKELPPQCKLSSNFPKPVFKNVFDEWLCSKDSIDTWLTPRK